MDDAMRREMERCAREGTPRPESSAVRAHVSGAFWSFANSWRDIFHTGVCDHAVKELCRLYVSRSVKCEFCGNQRSIKAFGEKLDEAQTDDLVNFEKSTKYDDRQKAALAYAEAITWRLDTDDAFWERVHKHYSEPELVELGCFIALTMGQQSWLRLLDIEHHQVMPGSAGSMAPGFETAEALAKAKASPDYWAKHDVATRKNVA
jgi:alkylhydroperoxidase family enzyme